MAYIGLKPKKATKKATAKKTPGKKKRQKTGGRKPRLIAAEDTERSMFALLPDDTKVKYMERVVDDLREEEHAIIFTYQNLNGIEKDNELRRLSAIHKEIVILSFFKKTLLDTMKEKSKVSKAPKTEE